MALPSLSVPEFETTIPSSGKKIRFRPFLVKEEKLLFIALETKDQKETIRAVTKLLSDCILDDVNIPKLASFDFEYLFLQLRSKSVGEITELQITHNDSNECKHNTKVAINLQSVKPPKIKDDSSRNIMITDTIGVRFNYPSIDGLDYMTTLGEMNDFDKVLKMVETCIECIYEGDTVYDSFEPRELEKFIGDMSQPQFEKVAKFFSELPVLEHKVTWKCEKCGKDDFVDIRGLQNFFM
tara:strand:+ start:661 stop:1377 length:717 start_codon:yes stop_codon:yes gene_type:complete